MHKTEESIKENSGKRVQNSCEGEEQREVESANASRTNARGEDVTYALK